MKKYTKNKAVRITDFLFNIAQTEALNKNRSVASQIEYWCKLGAALETKLSNSEIEALIADSQFKNQ